MNVNYKSDFSFVIDLYDADGNPVGFPPFDFRVTLATSTRSAWQYAASSVSGLRTSCAESAGRLLIVCDSHQLAPGRLTAQFHAYADDQAFPDGQRLTVTPFDTGISLVTGPGEEHVVPCVRLRIPVRVQMPAPLLIAYDLAAKAGFQGTPEEYAAALARLPELMEQVRLLREEISQGTLQNGSLINLSATDRDTQWTLATAIDSIPSPHFGALLMFVGEGGAWQMWQFTGRDYSSEADWQPVGVRLSASALFIEQDGTPSDVSVLATDNTQWAAG